MKSFIVLALAGAVLAQDLSALPACGQTCISNMVGIASSKFGCGAGDVLCYCTNVDFGNGVRDCSNEACTNKADAAAVIAFGTAFCASALASASTTGGALPVLTSALATLTNSDGSIPTATGPTTLATSAGGDVSSHLSSIHSAAESASRSLASEASSIHDSLSHAASSVLASGSAALSSAASAASSRAAGTGASTGGAPMMTGLPFAGAAGIAAWLLL